MHAGTFGCWLKPILSGRFMITTLARDGGARGIAEIIEHRDRTGRERQRKSVVSGAPIFLHQARARPLLVNQVQKIGE
jgi:hypothetical protein